jgi:hypothetical protein
MAEKGKHYGKLLHSLSSYNIQVTMRVKEESEILLDCSLFVKYFTIFIFNKIYLLSSYDKLHNLRK